MSNKQKHIKPCTTAKREQDNKAIKQAGNGTMTFMVWSIAGTSLVIYNNPIFGQDTDLAGSGFKYLLVGLGPLSKGVLFTDLNEDGQYDNGTDTFIGITDIDGTVMAISPPEIGQTTVAHLNNAYDFATGLVLNGTWRSLPYEGNEDVVISALTDLLANELDNAPEGAVAEAGGMAAYLQPMLNDIFGNAPARDGSGDPTPMITLADVLNSENYDPLSNGVAGQLMSRAVIALTQSDAVDWASARTELQGLFSDYRTRIGDTNDDNDSVILSGDLASDIEDALQDAADRPVEDVLPDVADRPVEDVSPDVADRPDENVSPDVTDDLVEDALPDVADRPVEDVSPDAADRPVEDVLQDEADRLVEDALLDASNRPIAFGPNGGDPVVPTGGGGFVPAIANPDPISPFDSLAPLGDNDNAEINEAPIEVISDGLSVAEGEASAITNALLEFTDVDNGVAELTYTITDAPDHGILQISSDGGSTWESLGSGRFTQVDIDANRVRYQHGGSENHADSFEYSVRDGANTVTGSFAITISPVNDAPTATESTSPAPDKAAVESGHDDVGGVIPGDDMASGSFIHSDPDAGQGDFTGGIPEVAFVGAATTDYTPIEDGAISTPVRGMYGTLTLMSGTWRYEIDNSATDMLAEGETVMDSFLIRIRDTADAVSNAIPIDIMITGTNDRPVITTTDSTTGTRIISDTNRDSINTFASLTGMAQVQDPDADDSAFTWAGDLQDTSLAHFGILSFDSGNTGMWTFNPDAAAINALSQGEQSVLIYDITATDAQGAISQAMPLMITITGINDAPTQVISDGLSVTEGGEREITTALLQFNDVDNDAEDRIYTITDAPDHGTLQKLVEGTWGDLGTNTFTQADIDAGRVRYQHGGSENLADSFEYSVRDGAEGDLNTNTVMGSFDITISQGNDAPTATETTSPAPDKEAVESGHDDVGGIILGDTIASGAFTHSDPDMAQSGFVAGTPEATRAGTTDYTSTPVRGMYGMLTLTSGTWRYEIDNSATDMLDEGDTVMDSFLIRIRDTAGAVSNAIPIDIMITGTNDRPVITTTDSTTGTRMISDTNRDSMNTFASLTGMAQAQDPDADDSAFTWGQTLQDISLAHFGTLSSDPGNTGMWTFDPDAAAINALSQGDQSVLIYDITATDAQGAISQAMPLMITITGINDAPTQVISDGLSVTEGGEREITTALLQFNDVDNDAEDLTYTITDAPDYGKLQKLVEETWGDLGTDTFTQADIDAGRVRYQHGGSENLADSFEYSVRDGANTVTGSFDVTISQGNDAPTATETTSPAPDKEARESGHNDDGSDDAGDTIASGAFTHSDPDMAQPGFVAGTPEAARAGTTDYMSTPVRGMYGTLALTSGTWRYEIDNSATDMLDEGEVVMDRFLIRIRDTAGAFSNIIPIDIMITGTNDRPVISMVDGGRTFTDASAGDHIGQASAPQTFMGEATASDVDADDNTFTWTGTLQNAAGKVRFATDASLVFTGGGANGGAWEFTPDAAGLNSLSQGITEQLIYDITATDAHGAPSVMSPLTIMLQGVNDKPELTVNAVDGAVTEAGGTDDNTAGDAMANGSLAITDPDTGHNDFAFAGNTLQGRADTSGVFKNANGVVENGLTSDGQIIGTYGTLTLERDGKWTYALRDDDPDTQGLRGALTDGTAAQVLRDEFEIQLVNEDGTTQTSAIVPITIDITGANDAPTDITTTSDLLVANYNDRGQNVLPSTGLFIATLGTIDVDIGDTHTYSITDVDGNTHASSFQLRATNGQNLGPGQTATTVSNIASENVHLWLVGNPPTSRRISENWNIAITTTDSNGGTYSEDFRIMRGGGLAVTGVDGTQAFTNGPGLLRENFDPQVAGNAELSYPTDPVTTTASQSWDVRVLDPASPEMPPTADMATVGPNNELTITAVRAGMSSTASDTPPVIRVSVTIADGAIVAINPDMMTGGTVVIDVTAPTGTTWAQIANLIRTGNIEGTMSPANPSPAAEYITATATATTPAMSVSLTTLQGGLGALAIPEDALTPSTAMIGANGELRITSDIEGASSAIGVPEVSVLLRTGAQENVEVEVSETGEITIILTAILSTTTWARLEEMINLGLDGSGNDAPAAAHVTAQVVIPEGRPSPGGETIDGEDALPEGVVPPKADSLKINGLTITSRFKGDNSEVGVPEIRVTVRDTNDQNRPSNIVVDDSDPERVHIIITKTAVDDDFFGSWGGIELVINSGYDENGDTGQRNDVLKYISARFDRFNNENQLLEDTGGITEQVLSGGVGVPASVTAPGLGLRLTLKESGETIDGSEDFDRPLITLRIDKKQGAPGSEPSARLVGITDSSRGTHITVRIEITETEDKPFTQWDIIRDYINNDVDYGLSSYVYVTLADVPDGVFPGSISVTGGRDVRGVVLSTPVEPKADSFTINGITITSRFEGDNSLEGVPEIRVTVNVSNDQDNPSTIVVDDSDPEHVHIIITKTEEDSFTTWGAIQLYITSGLDENGRYNQGNDVRKYISARVTGERPLLEDTGGITERVLSGGVGVPASVTAPGLGLRLTLKDAGETIDGSAEFDRPLITLRIDKKQGAPGSDPSARLVDVVDHYPANSATVVVEITETEDKPFTQWDIIRDFINDEKDVFGLPGFVHAALTDVPDGVFPGSISVTGGRDLTHETIIPVTPEMLEGGEGVPLIIGTPDTLTVADGTSTDQLRFIAARIGDGDASTTDSAPHITVALTTGGTQIGFRIDATTTEGTTAITIEAPAGISWGDIASAINTDTNLQGIFRAEAVGTSGNPAEAFTAKELTGGAYGQDPVIAVPAIPAVNVPQAEEMIDDVEQVAVGLLVGTLSDGVGSTRFEVLYNEDDEDEDEADERVFVVADDDQLYYIGDLTGDADADTYEITVRAYDGPASGDFTQEYEYVVNLDML